MQIKNGSITAQFKVAAISIYDSETRY